MSPARIGRSAPFASLVCYGRPPRFEVLHPANPSQMHAAVTGEDSG